MAEYYIRTPDRDESRGPFSPAQLLTLAEAEQITEETLYFDESKEEWIPIALNPGLKEEVFPERKKLSLRQDEPEEIDKSKKKKKSLNQKKAETTVNDMLTAAEMETKSARKARRNEKSFLYSIYLSENGLSAIMLLSAITILIPHFGIIKEAFAVKELRLILNYPLIFLGVADFVMGILYYFSVSGVASLLRGRAMLTLGFGVYTGWALGESTLMMASATAGLGIFLTTLSKRLWFSIVTIALALSGSAALAYLATIGYLDNFLDIYIEIYSPK